MPDSVSVSVGKAVTAMIAAAVAAGDLSQTFTPERSYADWDLKQEQPDALALRESDKLRVDVVAVMTEQKASLASRGKVELIVPVDIAVRYKFGADKQDDDNGRVVVEKIDELTLLVQEIYLMFMPQRLTDFTAAVWDDENGGTRILANPMRDHLRQLRQFTGIVRVTFKAHANL